MSFLIKNMTGLANGFAIIKAEELFDDPQPILSGLTLDQAEREFLRLKKEKETAGNRVLQD